jgi:cellulose synthase/poly-beta-1,6-N-acetylglucosamine synthase-like glycosyltransferase
MSIGFDPLVSSFLFTASLLPHGARPKAARELPVDRQAAPPLVTVIVALYREKWADIEMTLESLLRQTIARDRYEVLWAIEARDEETQIHAEEAVRRLHAAGIASRLVISHGGIRLKAYALNRRSSARVERFARSTTRATTSIRGRSRTRRSSCRNGSTTRCRPQC